MKWTETGSISGDVTAAFHAIAGWFTNDAEYQDWKKTLQPPKVAPAPAAPQTASEMRNWTPADAAAAYKQLWATWQKVAIPDLPPDPAGEPNRTWLWVGLAIAGVSAAVLFGGGRR